MSTHLQNQKDILIDEETITPYHAKYIAYELTRKHASNDLDKLTSSLQDAKVDLNPHQVDAALFAFQSPLSKGAILADEVGLGKTIEAGLILSQKWAERRRRLLIICPANLRKQWSQELADKFYLPTKILESKSFNQETQKGSDNPFYQDEIVICSYHFAKSKEKYISSTFWNLVVIDEAHKLRNVYKSDNKIGKSIKESLSNIPKVLLTATPLQNSILELYGLVSIIDEYIFGDKKSFKNQFSRILEEENFDDLKQRIDPICKRTLRRQVTEYISYTNRIAIAEDFQPFKDEQHLYESVSEYLRKPNLYALPRSQRKLMTLILRKLLASSSFAIQNTLDGLSNKLKRLLKSQERYQNVDVSTELGYFEDLKDEWLEELEQNEAITDADLLSDAEIEEVKQEIEELDHYKELAQSITKNAKGEKLFTALEKGFNKLEELGGPQKAVIFTESTRTQDYLKQLLENGGYEGQIVLFNGSNNNEQSKLIYQNWLKRHEGTDRITGSKASDTRQAIIDYFRDEATILIATEAAAEGINLQFCSLVVNYDLPWNPQRIEQRIGRCHRYGQKYDVVVINFINQANAADQRVYKLLDEKLKLFSGVFGASDEVLGNIESGVDFEKRIAHIYQECRKPEEIQAAFDALQQELDQDIKKRLEKTRKQLLENFDEDVNHKLKFNLEKGREYLGAFEDKLWQLTQFFLSDYADFNDVDKSFFLKSNPFSDKSIRIGSYKILSNANNQKKSEIEIPDDTNIYRFGHPLAQNIINTCKIKKLSPKHIVFDYTNNQNKISVLDELIGQKGWLKVTFLTIESFETEEHILLSGISDKGEMLNQDYLEKLFSVPGKVTETLYEDEDIYQKLNEIEKSLKQELLQDNLNRNNDFFDEEDDKLDKWAEDKKVSLEKEIKDLDSEIKLKKSEARRLLDLQQKVEAQRTIKELEKKRNTKRQNLFEAQDNIDSEKDKLLSTIEKGLDQKASEEHLFTIKWEVV